MTQRSLAVLVFSGAIALGMQLAGPGVRDANGQVQPMAPPRSVEDIAAGKAGGQAPDASAALQQQQQIIEQLQAKAAADAAKDSQRQERNRERDEQRAGFGDPNSTSGVPNVANRTGNNNGGNNGNGKGRGHYVPSEVETFIPSMAHSGDPRAVVHTSDGNFTMRLFSTRAPQTVRNFIDLSHGDREFLDVRTSKKTRRPFYNNLTFHRVLPGYLVATGCPYGTGRGGPGYTIQDEINPALKFDHAGMVAMAPELKQTDGSPIKDSNGSQFFITLAPMPEWDGKFTIFGEIVGGMEIVTKISHAPAGPTSRPIKKIFINQVEILDETTAEVAPPTTK